METETKKVLWPKKFGDEIVTINASDFDPKIHKDPAEKPGAKVEAAAEKAIEKAEAKAETDAKKTGK